MVNTIPILTKAALGVTDAHQVEEKLRAELQRFVEEATVRARPAFLLSEHLPASLIQRLLDAKRPEYASYTSLGAFVNTVGYRHHAKSTYAKYLLELQLELWLQIKFVIEFNRLIKGEETIALTLAERSQLLASVGLVIA